MGKHLKPIIVVSAINFFEGGPLSILNDCLIELKKNYSDQFKIIALVHNKRLSSIANISFIEFPKSRKSYIYRLYYEYYYFNKLSKKLNPYLWFSLHDVTPNVQSKKRVVYCHNASAFYKFSFHDLIFQPTQILFSLLYKILYRINIKKNNYVIVQQSWLREIFKSKYHLPLKKIIVAHPLFKNKYCFKNIEKPQSAEILFFYPAFPRIFKNFELIGEAANILINQGVNNFKVILTLNGSENTYSRKIVNKYQSNKNLLFIGIQPREKIFELYDQCHYLIFPSKLESWGLPISEFKETKKPVLLANLSYAYEALGDYDNCLFFSPNNPNELAQIMKEIISNNAKFQINNATQIMDPFVNSWNLLLKTVLDS